MANLGSCCWIVEQRGYLVRVRHVSRDILSLDRSELEILGCPDSTADRICIRAANRENRFLRHAAAAKPSTHLLEPAKATSSGRAFESKRALTKNVR